MAGVRAMARGRLRMLSIALATGVAVAPGLVFGATHAGATAAAAAAGCSDVTGIAPGATPVTSAISAAGEVDCFTFNAQTHNRVRVRVVTTSGTLVPSAQLFTPKGTPLCAAATTVDSTCGVANKGTQTLAIKDASGTNTGGYTVSVQILQKPLGCTPLKFGSPSNSGSISVPGTADCYTFKAGNAARLLTRIVATSGPISPTVEVVNGNGTSVCGPDATLEQSCRLITAGPETIFVRDSAGPNPGAYTLYAQLDHTKTCATVKLGKALQTTIAAAGETDCYRVAAVQGDNLRVAVAATSGALQTQTDVIKPNGTTLCTTSTATEQTCNTTDDGVHTILVSDAAGTKTGGYTIYVQVLNNPVACATATYGQHNQYTNGTIAFPGAQNCYVFNGMAGTGAHLKVLSTGGTWTPKFEILKPNGNQFDPRYCDVNATDIRCVLGITGQYLIIVRDADGVNTGTYKYSLTERTFTG